jgi:hypothetical protein
MPTSVHLPKPLLEAVDRRAKALNVSRNHLIITALTRELRGDPGWSVSFFERLTNVDPKSTEIVDEMMDAIKSAKRSKAAHTF